MVRPQRFSAECPLCHQPIVEGLPARTLTCPRCNIIYSLKIRGIFIGRFQPFHNGHLKVVKEALKEVDELAVVIGSAQFFHTQENPFTADEREEMIRRALAAEGIRCRITQAADIASDTKYPAHIKSIAPRFGVVYAATNKLNADLFTKAGYHVRTCPRYLNIEATRVRDAMRKNMPWEHLVPPAVADYLKKIKGAQRVRAIRERRHDDA